MSKNTTIIIAVAIIVILLGVGGVYLFTRTSSNPTAVITPTPQQQQVLTLQPSDIGLSLTSSTYTKGSSSGPAMHMEITKLDGISSVDCEIHYTHVIDNGSRIAEGILCNLDATNKTSITQDIPFATCSDVCHFHKDIQDIQAILKITKTDGKIYQVKDTMTL